MGDSYHQQYQSPFSWRYGSPEMRLIWSEINKRRLWRRLWVELARAQQTAGIVTQAQLDDLVTHQDAVDIERAEAIEAEIQHDLMSEVRAFAEQCPIGGAIIHLGATSADIEDNADVLRLRDSVDLILGRLRVVLAHFALRIRETADIPTMALTHLQPAEPTTVGYRLASYAQDLVMDFHSLTAVRASLRGKGFKGAVGTQAAYAELLTGSGQSVEAFESQIMSSIGLPAFPITGQVYPRKQDHNVVSALAALAATVYRFAFDLRLLQSPYIGEWREPFGKAQVGSSAMPFKRNPINAEKLNSLARLCAAFVAPTWDNAAHSLLERTLDDSANRREILPTVFLAADELLRVTERLISRMEIDRPTVQRNLDRFGTFAALERVLMAAAKAGADRQQMHETLRELSMEAWREGASGSTLAHSVMEHPTIRAFLTVDHLTHLLDASQYTGTTAVRARQFADTLDTLLSATA